jgi:hypothetical protein
MFCLSLAYVNNCPQLTVFLAATAFSYGVRELSRTSTERDKPRKIPLLQPTAGDHDNKTYEINYLLRRTKLSDSLSRCHQVHFRQNCVREE